MKKATQILALFALLLLGLGANAQQTVTEFSVHKYKATEANKDASSFAWYVLKPDGSAAVQGTDYQVWLSRTNQNAVVGDDAKYVAVGTDIGDFHASKYILYIKWLVVADGYKVRFQEKSSDGCFDAADNEKDLVVNVKANTFSVSAVWDQKPVAGSVVCASHGDNSISFTVTKTDGMFNNAPNDKWHFEYEMSVDGGAYQVVTNETGKVTVDGVELDMVSVDKGTNTKQLTFTYNTVSTIGVAGNETFIVKFRIKDARDGYMAQASGLNAEVIATIHRLPTSTEISAD